MLRKLLIIVMTVLALVHGAWPDMMASGIVPLLLVLSGLAYGVVATDAENPTAYLVVVLAIGMAASVDVLSHIQGIGEFLDAIFDALMLSLYSSAVTIVVLRAYNRIKQ